jgi:hypothetical protein
VATIEEVQMTGSMQIVKLLLIAATLLAFTGVAHADHTMVCDGSAVIGTAVFQKVNGVNTKLRVEGRIGQCPFSTTGRYGEAGRQIVGACAETQCRVTAIVGKVSGRELVGIAACCELWIKRVVRVETICADAPMSSSGVHREPDACE